MLGDHMEIAVDSVVVKTSVTHEKEYGQNYYAAVQCMPDVRLHCSISKQRR